MIESYDFYEPYSSANACHKYTTYNHINFNHEVLFARRPTVALTIFMLIKIVLNTSARIERNV